LLQAESQVIDLPFAVEAEDIASGMSVNPSPS